jgi:hypothetical protein
MTRHTPLIWATLALLSGCPEPEPETDPALDPAPTSPLEGATLTPADAVESSVLTCTPETNSPDTDVEAMSLAYTWFISGAMLSEPTTNTLDGQTFDKGDEVTCSITTSDSAGNEHTVYSNTVTIGNTAPVLTSVTITPATAYTGNILTAVANATDEDSADSLSYTFTWFSGDTELSATGNQLYGATSFEKGERISVQLVVSDGTEDSAVLTSAAVDILNSPPGAPELSITPSAPQFGVDALICQVDTPSADLDDDPVTYSIQWTVNSLPYLGTPSTTHYTDDTIPGTETAEGDLWECRVTPEDPEEQGVAAIARVGTGNYVMPYAKMLTGEGPKDNAGWAVASAGDVNGDGFSDILVGALYEETDGKNAGAAYLIYGSSAGISDMSLDKADAKLMGENYADLAGCSVASAGDVNGDSYSDILVGAKMWDACSGSSSCLNEGITYIIYGSSTSISDMDLADADTKLYGQFHSFAGASVSSAGDVNNDGYDDVLTYSQHSSVQVHLIYGSSTGISDMSLASADAKLTGEGAGDQAGHSVSTAGDTNGDGYSDVFVGAPKEDTGATDAGSAYLVLGSSTGISDMNLSGADAKLTGKAYSDYAGNSVSTAGDVNNDGYDDVIVGAPNVASGTGATYIVLGSSLGISDMSLASADGTLTGEGAGDQAGHSVSSAGDVNNDGYSDVIVGAYGAKNVGAAYLVFGSSSGIAAMNLASADGTLLGLNAGDETGFSVSSAGDVNGDDYSDVLVGAPKESTAGAEAGSVYLLPGGW